MSGDSADELRRVARSAARWLALMESGAASAHDLAGLQRWRERSASHEYAWQKAQALRTRFEGLPTELAMASLDRPDPSRRRLLKGVLGLAAIAPAAWLATRTLPLDAWRADLSTATGERRRITLADGSQLDLNTASAVNLDEGRRRLALVRGEIALRLAGGAPFSVDTLYGEARLAGGELCVRQDDAACEFSVFAGVAEIRPSASGVLVLGAGQRVRLDRAGVEPVHTFDIRQPGWCQGVITANDRPLGAFLRELERYRPGILRWSPALESLRVTGSFRLDDTDRILALLAASLPLDVRSRTRYWVTLVPRGATA
ncbi:FecR domain-containing protein [Pseudomonas sp. RIT-PI-AD]|uniref:FecR domain-containing protein n=1 Tax=Pseudomonas sp. RIT-PI-AD TaxID=3035294 RepID=UPI0021DAD88F|nr:FecR domain-containing protein [Pseudomonas sp. RIT-PI-AD]